MKSEYSQSTCYYRLGSQEAAFYETHSSDWRCQDCGGPQRHADCVLPSDGLMIPRHAGPSLPNRGYPASGRGEVAAGAPQSLRPVCVLSHDGQVAGLRPTSGGIYFGGRGGRSCWFRPCPSPTYYATRQRVNRLRHAGPLKRRAIDSFKTLYDDCGWFSPADGCYAGGPRRKKSCHATVVCGLPSAN